MEPCEPHGGQGIIKRNVLRCILMDMFTWWPPQDLHLPSPSICREANLLSFVVLGVSALVTVWGVTTPVEI